MTEPRIDAPQTSLRYTCPFPGCSRSFRDFWRLKVHYRAAPGARGSGVERGHGMELPFCPLCNLDLRDVKYHKCAAGPAACSPAARSRNNQAAGNNMAPRQMQAMPGQPVGPYMIPHNGMMPYNPHFPNSAPGPYGVPPNTHMPGTHPGMQQQQQHQQHNQLLPVVPLLNQGNGHMQQQMPPQQQQHLQRSASAPNPGSMPSGTMGMPMMMQPSAAAVGQPMGKQWWQQGQMIMQQQPQPQQQQSQQQLMLQIQPHQTAANSGNSNSMQMPLQQQQQQYSQVQHQQYQQQEQQFVQPGLPRMMSNGSAQMNAAGMIFKSSPVTAMQPGDYGMHRQQAWQQPSWQQQQQQLSHAPQAQGMQNFNMPPLVGSQMDPPQQQQHMQLQLQHAHTGNAPAVASGSTQGMTSSSWMQPAGFSTAAAAEGQMAAAAAVLQGSTVSANSSRASHDTTAADNTAPQTLPGQQQLALPATTHSQVNTVGFCSEPMAAAVPAAAAAALQQLPMYVTKIVEDFRADLHSLRSSAGSGSTSSTAAEVRPGSTAVLPQRGNSSSSSSSPVNSSGIAAADGRAVVVGVKRALDDALGHNGSGAGAAPAKRQATDLTDQAGSQAVARTWTDTPPPSEAHEALLQLAGHVEQAAANMQEEHSAQFQHDVTNCSPSTGVNPVGVLGGLHVSPDGHGGYQPDSAHAAQVSSLLGMALEAANKCMQDPTPVVRQLLDILDEHVSIVVSKHQHQQPESHTGMVQAASSPIAATRSQQPADSFDAAAAAGRRPPVVVAADMPAAGVAQAAAETVQDAAKCPDTCQQQSDMVAPPAAAAAAAVATGSFNPSDWYPTITPLQQQQQDGSSSGHDQRCSPTVLDTLQHYHTLQQQPISIPRSAAAVAAAQTQSEVEPPPLPPLPPAAYKSIAAQQQQQQQALATAAAGSGHFISTATDVDTAAAAADTTVMAGQGDSQRTGAAGSVSGGFAGPKALLQYNTAGLGFEPGAAHTPVQSPQQVSA